eukprot:TRINITY_DN86_c0_g1_i2.p1 TRINITY_DN86_c0_g1~~TRINITY_DN86_c0_g1_i2.p1  ORF type:complete len:435 (-),score=94.87 TRINITY_DN86_c0_g1_i2:308-1612(-)
MIKVFALLAAFIICCNAAPTYVMLALDTVNDQGFVKDPLQLNKTFAQLANGSVEGVMLDHWWGLIEKSPKNYNWAPYLQVTQMAEYHGLKMQAVMSFHACGGNVGDPVNIPIPQWVRDSAASFPGLWYTDQNGHTDDEYISLWADDKAVLQGRTPVQCYQDVIASYMETFSGYVNRGTLAEIQLGLGPAGELRYPSYQLSQWSFPGTGAFQCFSDIAVADFVDHARASGLDYTSPPHDAGDYNSNPDNTEFFTIGYTSDYGHFFLDWYSDSLVAHGQRVLYAASKAVQGKLHLATKVSGIHWLYRHNSHAAELTAGYYNTNGYNGYEKLAALFSAFETSFDFTCLEMRDQDQCSSCAPEELVSQVIETTNKFDVTFSGENALPRYDQAAYDTIFNQVSKAKNLGGFTYLRVDDNLLSNYNWGTFVGFVKRLLSL